MAFTDRQFEIAKKNFDSIATGVTNFTLESVNKRVIAFRATGFKCSEEEIKTKLTEGLRDTVLFLDTVTVPELHYVGTFLKHAHPTTLKLI